jgi:diacylglycerol kinase (ATP)
MRRALVVLNPIAGSADADMIRQACEAHSARGLFCEIHETTPGVLIAETVRAAVSNDFDLCVAAGGDGTVAAVASGLVHTGVPLGIIPIGTGNVLARELGIPLEVEAALSLLAGTHATRTIDAMQVGEQVFLLAIGVGISAIMMRDTHRRAKRLLGRAAYLWTGFRALFGIQPRRFDLIVDGQRSRPRAAEIMVTNSAIVGDPLVRWGPHVLLDDGCVDVCLIRARTAMDYVRIARNLLVGRRKRDPHLSFLRSSRSIVISTSRPLPVQADGEFIGQTPVQIKVVPQAVSVIVPLAGE